ncbi:hypothetical protein N9A45_01530 [bacterium]|nr:hypothetical protein [bacterium]
MLLIMYDVVFMLTTALVGFVFSYIVVTVFNIGGDGDASLSRDLEQLALQISTLLINTIFLPLKGTWATGTDVSATFVSRGKWLVAFALLTVVTLLMHYYHDEMLSILDGGWTCTVVPILRNIITPMLQILRIFFAVMAPFLNAYLVFVGQVLNAWYITVAQCSHINLFRIFTEIGSALITGTQSIKNWFGANGIVDDDNNFYNNNFEIAKPVNHTMQSIAIMEDALSCACKRFEPVFNIAFLVFKEPHVVAMIDNGWQTLIRIFQMVFRLLFGEFPDVLPVAFKAERTAMEFGLAVDAILFKALGNMIKQFDPKFTFTTYPKESVATIYAHFTVAFWHAFGTLGINVPLHLLGSFKSDISPFDMKVWSLETSLSHVQSAMYSTGVLLQWSIYVIERLMTDTLSIGDVFSSPETPLDLECDWARDVVAHKYVSLSYTAGCSVYNAGIASANLWYIAYGLTVELLLKSVFTHEPQNVFRTFQRWEGPMLPRNKVYTCTDRTSASAYNYETDVHNPNGWLWTQDASQCNCDRYWGTTADEDEPIYQPWCGQVNLNFDVFAPLDALIMHVSHGVLGPGFGDAFPFIDPIQNIEINIPQMGVEKSIALPFALPPLTRTAVESVRIMTRVALSYGDILTGHFFNYPINCGHGLNLLQLQKKYEIEFNEPSDALKDEDMRWANCEERKYGPKRTFQESNRRWITEPIPVCDSNDDGDCMCSYLQPLQPNSKCKCIARYPDLDVTTSSQQVGDLVEKRFTSEEVSMHWCNSMIVEWTFQNAAAFANALDFIVSLGPLNPTCDVVDRIIKEEGINNAADDRSGSTYLITETPTLDIAGEFTSSTTKIRTIKSLYASSPSGCSIKPGGWIDATDENGDPVLNPDGTQVQVMTAGEWSCDASQTFETAQDLDPIDVSKVPGCRIWGRTDFFCSAGLFVRNYKRLSMNMARQVINNGISLMSGNFVDVNLKTLPRLCDYERIFGSIAAMIAGIIPRISTELKQAIAKYVNMIFQVVFVQSIRSVLTLTNIVTTIVMDFVQGTITQESVTETFEKGVKVMIKGVFFIWRDFWKTTGEFLDAIKDGAGDICDIVVDITDIVIEQVEEGLLDIVTLSLKVFFQFIAALSGDTSVIGEMFDNAFQLWAKIQLLLIEQMWKILAEVFAFFGPVGKFFEVLSSVVCNALNFVFGTIDSIIQGLCFGFCSGIGWEPMKCVEMKSSHSNHTAGNLGKHFLGATDNHHLPKKVAEALDWNGTTVCDHFMTAAAEYSYTDLRPLERAQWIECIEMKFIGVEIAKFVGSKTFPTDIMYNWKRKYILLYDLARAIKIVLGHYVQEQTLQWANVRMDLYEQGLDADMYMRFFQKANALVGTVVNNIELTNMVSLLFEHVDPDYENAANPSNTARAWSVYNNVKSVYKKSTHEWDRRDATKQLWNAVDATHNAHMHLHQWWSAIGTEMPGEATQTETVFSNLKRSVHHVWHEKIRKTRAKRPKKTFRLFTPKKTAIRTCKERGNPVWCTNCNVADNLVESVLEQSYGLGEFYSSEFPLIIHSVSHYFNDLGDYNREFFENTFSRLTSKSPVPKTHIRWSHHVTRDWNTLFDNFTSYIGDMGNETLKKAWLGQVDSFLDGSRKFVTVKNSSYVPFFGYSFHHMYNYVLFSTCDLKTSIFVSEGPTQKERLANIDTALIVCAVVILLIITNTTWSIIPLVWLANTVVIVFIVNFLYLYVVYGYMLNCVPLIPYTFVEDINAWYHTRIQPGCFYKMLPNMALNSTEDACLTCSGPQQYMNCAEYTVANYQDGMLGLDELIREYHIFWPGLFWVRWQWPALAIFLVRHGLLPLDTVLGSLAMSAWQGQPIDPVWVDCYHAMWLDNIVAGAIILLALYMSAKITVVLIQTAVQAGMLVWYTYTALGYMSLTVEQSVVIE